MDDVGSKMELFGLSDIVMTSCREDGEQERQDEARQAKIDVRASPGGGGSHATRSKCWGLTHPKKVYVVDVDINVDVNVHVNVDVY